MTPDNVVRDHLNSLSKRGVLHNLSETKGRGGKIFFRFRWLMKKDYVLEVNPRIRQLSINNLLPGLVYRSYRDSELRTFIANRGSLSIPEHRRVDAERVNLTYKNQKQQVTLVMKMTDEDYVYASSLMFRLINDLFIYLKMYHIDYLQEYFGLPEE